MVFVCSRVVAMDPRAWTPLKSLGRYAPPRRAWQKPGPRRPSVLRQGRQGAVKAMALAFLPAISRARRRPLPVVRASGDPGCCHDNPWHGPEAAELLPVTVLSGFLGSGKTTLLKRILRSSTEIHDKDEPAKVAVIVNDMGEVNLDASEIKNSKLIQEEATMVEMHNGCICCTLRGDLLKTVKALSEEKAFDYLVIESTGISEPLPVAQTFTMDVDDLEEGELEEGEWEEGEWEEGEIEDEIEEGEMENIMEQDFAEEEEEEEGLGELKSLSHFARLDTMVTVVDALNIYDVLSSLETLAEKNIAGMAGNDEETDDRSIAQLMLDQIEFANVILLSKVHLMKDPKAVQEIRALLQKLNPSAKVIVPSQPNFADVPLSDLINTNLFDMDKAESSAGWMQELAKAAEGGHTPETEEYDISSMVFRCHDRPFHPDRLADVLASFGNYASMPSKKASVPHGVFSGVVRAKGHLWLATADARPIDLHVAGRHIQLGASEMPFLAAVPKEEWEDAFHEYHSQLLEADSWNATHGDRGSMVVFIGVKLDNVGIQEQLETALLTDSEMAEGKKRWKALHDPFFGGEYFEGHTHLEEPKLVILEE